MGIVRSMVVALAWLAALSGASAQFQREERGARPGVFDFYVLALSWSSSYCESAGDRRDNRQCEIGRKLDFVVHGLWPQYERGFPTECTRERDPSRAAMDIAREVYPAEGLARYEWRKHGTCSGLDAKDYFTATRNARGKVKIPEKYQGLGADTKTSPGDIEKAFLDANPGLKPDMIAVICRRGLLQEVRICMEKDLGGFRACQAVDRDACRSREIVVPAVR